MNKEEIYSLAQSRKNAKLSGKTQFQADFKCEKCGSYDCYTNQKGRACVQCKINATEKRRKEQPDKVRAERREYNNKHRPSHNPEKFLLDSVKATGYLEAGTQTPEEFKALTNKCSLLKALNMDYPLYTNDHIIPKAGTIYNGEKIYGRTVSENLRPILISENKSKSNRFDSTNKDLKESMYITEKDHTLTPVDWDTSTEELRRMFYEHYGITTKAPNNYEKKLDDGSIKETTVKRKPKTHYQAMRSYVVLELMMAGVHLKKLGREDYPLLDVWDEDKNKYVKPVIYVTKNLHSKEVIRALFFALCWVDAAKDALYWKDRGLVLSDEFNSDDIQQRIEQHFIEWVNNWSLDMNNPKLIYDFLKMPPRQIKKDWIGCYLARKHLDTWYQIYNNNADNAYYAGKVISAWNIGKSVGASEESLSKLWISKDFPSVEKCEMLVSVFKDSDQPF